MPQENRTRKFARAAICAAFGVFLVLAGGVAVAYAEDDDDAPADQKFMRSFLRAIGLRNGQEAGIEYKERPPLVVPPSRNLPPPAASISPGKNNPAWPDDPDEKQRKAVKKAKAERSNYVDWLNDVQKDRLTPEEWAAGKTDKPATGEPARGPAAAGSSGGATQEMTPSQLGYKSTVWDNLLSFSNPFKSEKEPEIGTFVREPPRAALTDPPAGYRTPSPNQPYGLTTKEDKGKATPVEPQLVQVGR